MLVSNTVDDCLQRQIAQKIFKLKIKASPVNRHSTEIAIFCPTFELAKTVCECFSLGGLKLDGQVAEVQVWVALSSAHLEDNRRQVDLYGRPCSPGRGPARSESNAKHRTIPSQ